jgi:2-polyprenyl-3-methyl-5-hydroxy-6-metoxy-1,4-benzoquinol methylase
MPALSRYFHDSAHVLYQNARHQHWNSVAQAMDTWHGLSDYYHQRLADVYRFLIAPGQRVLEIGCARGDLLAAVSPSVGIGVDFAPEMLQRAARRHPQLRFVLADAHNLALCETFDVIILSDLINDVWDVQTIFEQLAPLCTAHTRIIINTYSRLWELPLLLAERSGLAKPTLNKNWLTVEDTANLLELCNFDLIRNWQEILWPLETPLLAPVANRYLVKMPPFAYFALSNFMVARPRRPALTAETAPLVSVIVPARNEAGNIDRIFERVPDMGRDTELVFVEGHSRDNTFAAIEQAMAAHPERHCKLLQQSGEGKGDAVRLGFDQASGEILMILDADLTVPPEDLPRFYQAIVSGKGEFINGVRLVYPMESQAMRFLNLLGNKFFSLTFSWLLGQSVKDTLCGTKVLWKSDYAQIAANRAYFGDFDPFGDFDLLFGAARLNQKIVDLPIRYRERTYGSTNIQRWKHGWLLLRMVLFASRRIKFV